MRNGENFLARALDSLLGQTFEDFELVVCDNASSDATEAICRDYQSRDARIRYERAEGNRGAIPNFNRVLELAAAPYFRWAAHDDEIAPEYLEKCVAVLDTDPGVVLCHSLVRIIDASGQELSIYDPGLQGADSASIPERFQSMVLQPHLCTEIFGLGRTEALRRSPLEGHFHGNDRAMLAGLVLLGRYHQITEPLFWNREHGQRYVRRVAPEERGAWAEAGAKRRVGTPTWQLYRHYRASVSRLVESVEDRRVCHAILRRWWLTNWHAARVGVEALATLYPPLHRKASALSQALGHKAPVPIARD